MLRQYGQPGLVRRELDHIGLNDRVHPIAAQGDRPERVLRGRIDSELVADVGDVRHDGIVARGGSFYATVGPIDPAESLQLLFWSEYANCVYAIAGKAWGHLNHGDGRTIGLG